MVARLHEVPARGHFRTDHLGCLGVRQALNVTLSVGPVSPREKQGCAKKRGKGCYGKGWLAGNLHPSHIVSPRLFLGVLGCPPEALGRPTSLALRRELHDGTSDSQQRQRETS